MKSRLRPHSMLMRAEENLYFVSMMKLVGHKAVKHIVIEGADHGKCGAACWPHVIAFIETRLAEMKSNAKPPVAPDSKKRLPQGPANE